MPTACDSKRAIQINWRHGWLTYCPDPIIYLCYVPGLGYITKKITLPNKIMLSYSKFTNGVCLVTKKLHAKTGAVRYSYNQSNSLQVRIGVAIL